MDSSIPAAELFLKYDYPETRDLMKAFLTVVSATLAFSVAFSDKIVRTHQSDMWVRRCMLSSWVLFFLALGHGGLSVILIATAAGCAIYGAIPIVPCGGWVFALWSWGAGLFAALLFGLGLLSMTFAAWRSLGLDARSADNDST